MFANGLLNCVSPLTLAPSFPPSLIPLSGLFPFVGQAGICTYSATKAAILALTRCTAIDVMLTLAPSLPHQVLAGLPIVLAQRLNRLWQLEEAVGDRVEAGVAQKRLQLRITHLQGRGRGGAAGRGQTA